MTKSLVFNVTRGAPELITPVKPTPYELKELSDVDDQASLRFQIPMIHIYRNEEHYAGSIPRGRDPAKVIKEAVAKALVPYYPFAGRLREKMRGKLVVECNGEGIIFIEADADITLKEFGDATNFVPPFPLEKLLCQDVPGSTGVLDTPLMFTQVTRFKCGGFILALRYNHTMADASGLALLMNTIAEFAHGAHSSRIQPVWMRHLLSAQNPPQVICEHPEYEEVVDTNIMTLDDMVEKSFFFGPSEIANLKRHIPPHKTATTFDIINASIWKCRTIALQLDPEEIVRYICIVNSRYKFNSFIPSGYYGNAFALPISVSTASKVSTNPVGYALELVQQAKAKVTLEYMHSIADFMVLNGRPPFTAANTFLVSDTTRAGFEHLDFGWGLPVYSGPAKGGIDPVPGVVGFCVRFNNEKGEKGIVFPMSLPRNAMDIFVKELNKLVNEHPPAMKHVISSI